jgi:hypothetical protein
MEFHVLEMLKIMKLKDNFEITTSVIDMLMDHFEYSIKDINSYDELTDREKEIIDKELFESITEK